MKTYFQKIGQSLMLPIATLPAAAILVGIGNYLPKQWLFANYLIQGGNVVLNNLALLFAVGLAIGMSVNKDGAAAIAGLIAFEVPVMVLKPATLATMLNVKVSQINPAFSALDNNVLIGISAGLIAAALYNRFHEVKLPMALSFFSGKRLVPIMAAFVMLIVTAVLYLVWPFVYDAIVLFATGISKLGFVGAGLYGFFNRLLIPTGLHHALNSVFWYNVAGINDIGNFWASHGVKGITGMYEAGFFPIMMFGLPAGAYAIYRNARPERKKEVGSLMLAGAFASFFTGVTEPLEFSFMFVAWPLYLLHAVFMGLSLGFAALMHWTASFSFSGGLVDYLLSFRMPLANQPYMLLVQGLVMAVIYYFGFDFAIKRFNLKTPGREVVSADVDGVGAPASPAVAVAATDDKYMRQAKQIYAAIGGHDNISVINNCTTRLRLQLKDTEKVDYYDDTSCSPQQEVLLTTPRSASMVTTAPDFKMLVALAAPIMTGISRLRPTIAAWEFSPSTSVINPDAFLIRGSRLLLVSGITRMLPFWKLRRASCSVLQTQRLAHTDLLVTPSPFIRICPTTCTFIMLVVPEMPKGTPAVMTTSCPWETYPARSAVSTAWSKSSSVDDCSSSSSGKTPQERLSCRQTWG